MSKIKLEYSRNCNDIYNFIDLTNNGKIPANITEQNKDWLIQIVKEFLFLNPSS